MGRPRIGPLRVDGDRAPRTRRAARAGNRPPRELTPGSLEQRVDGVDDVLHHRRRCPQDLTRLATRRVNDTGLARMPASILRTAPRSSCELIRLAAAGHGAIELSTSSRSAARSAPLPVPSLCPATVCGSDPAKRSPSLHSTWPLAMPNTRWPSSPPERNRILSRAALLDQALGEGLATPVDVLGSFGYNHPAAGARAHPVTRRTHRLIEQTREDDSLWYRDGSRVGGGACWRKLLVALHLYHHGGSCVCIGVGTRYGFPVQAPA